MKTKTYMVKVNDSDFLNNFESACEFLEKEWGAEEVEQSEDCIKREDAIDTLYNFFDYDYSDVDEFLEAVANTVKELPPAVPQTKRGKWMVIEKFNCHAKLECSICKRQIAVIHDFGELLMDRVNEEYPFCHCGARMDADMRESDKG